MQTDYTEARRETFWINDVKLKVNPSDIRAMEDDFVIEESYPRSKAVFSLRSKHARSKISITIPFDLQGAIENQASSYEDASDFIKIVGQLNSYPFCFIKSSRMSTYISGLYKSSTGFLIFAVDEINLTARAEASSVVFLELVLVHFNHNALVRDFRFSNQVSLDKADYRDETFAQFKEEFDAAVAAEYTEGNFSESTVGDLSLSAPWRHHFRKVVKGVQDNIAKFKDIVSVPGFEVKEEFLRDLQLLHVSFGIPTPREVVESDEAAIKDFDYDARVVTTVAVDELTVEEFAETAKKFNEDTTNIDDPSKEKQEAYARLRDGSSFVGINWTPLDLFGDTNSVVTSITIRRKNRLAINQIVGHRAPVIQYMGRWPTSLAVNFVRDSSSSYQDEESDDTLAFLKQSLYSKLEENHLVFPQMIAHNYIRVYSLLAYVLGTTSFVPNQFHISASSSNQGLESFNMTMMESNMDEFLDFSRVEKSGKNSDVFSVNDKVEVVLDFLGFLEESLKDFVGVNGSTGTVQEKGLLSPLTGSSLTQVVDIYKDILALGIHLAEEHDPGTTNTKGENTGSGYTDFVKTSKITELAAKYENEANPDLAQKTTWLATLYLHLYGKIDDQPDKVINDQSFFEKSKADWVTWAITIASVIVPGGFIVRAGYSFWRAFAAVAAGISGGAAGFTLGSMISSSLEGIPPYSYKRIFNNQPLDSGSVLVSFQAKGNVPTGVTTITVENKAINGPQVITLGEQYSEQGGQLVLYDTDLDKYQKVAYQGEGFFWR